MSTVVSEIPIIDADTHVVEPPDLWTSRISSKWGDLRPHVEWDESSGTEAWFTGGVKLSDIGSPAMAGWHEHPPLHPRRWADADPDKWRPAARLAMMDAYGIQAQILYPNVAVFDAKSLLDIGDRDLALACIRAYNEFQTEWYAESGGRLIPVTSLPFWDMEATLAEIERCAALGHRGVVFTQDPSHFGLPRLTDRHWDPMWASAQEKGLPVNFHIASGAVDITGFGVPENGMHANYAMMGISFFMSNARTISQLICGGICHRFPELNFVSVESGIGWVPYALEGLDWQWQNCGVPGEHPEYDLLPSEYFRRQIYACFWFERDSAIATIERIGADNVLYETDYPHPTSMSPGPASTAQRPDEFLRDNFSGLDELSLRKILHDNAARLYGLE